MAPRSAGGGPLRKWDGDPAPQRLTAVYEDPDVTALRHRHRIQRRPATGTITQRFPTPFAITRSFLAEAYTEIGLAASHIEQLTGQPAGHVLQPCNSPLRSCCLDRATDPGLGAERLDRPVQGGNGNARDLRIFRNDSTMNPDSPSSDVSARLEHGPHPSGMSTRR